MLVLISYDVNTQDAAGRRRLRLIAKQCVNYGQRVQNSVFECILDAAQCRQLQHKLCSLMDKEKDSLRFYYLGNRYEAKVEHFGINAGYQPEASTNTQLDSLIPASKISNLSQGMFVGAVADNFDERIEQKIFHAEIVIDREKLAGETASDVPIPEISSFRDADGVDRMEEIIRRNYTQIKEDVTQIIKRELRRIAEDPALRHLLAKK